MGVLPNFFIAGATASGTTFLTSLLLQHPNIYLPKRLEVEPHFFSISDRYKQGIDWYQGAWFSEWKGEKAIGERSTSYFHFPEAAIRLKEHVPLAKFVFILRHPAERAFAQYRYMVLRGIEELNFQEALAQENYRLDREKRHHEYVGRSLYGKQLDSFLNFFLLKQVLFLSSEKLKVDTKTQLRRVTDFLEVAPLENFKISSDFPTPSVKDIQIQIKARLHFGKQFKHIVEAIRHKTENYISYIKTELDRYYLNEVLRNISDSKERLSDEMKDYLEKHFQHDQMRFFDLAKNSIDFEPWI